MNDTTTLARGKGLNASGTDASSTFACSSFSLPGGGTPSRAHARTREAVAGV
jgi:hypothetical protein